MTCHCIYEERGGKRFITTTPSFTSYQDIGNWDNTALRLLAFHPDRRSDPLRRRRRALYLSVSRVTPALPPSRVLPCGMLFLSISGTAVLPPPFESHHPAQSCRPAAVLSCLLQRCWLARAAVVFDAGQTEERRTLKATGTWSLQFEHHVLCQVVVAGIWSWQPRWSIVFCIQGYSPPLFSLCIDGKLIPKSWTLLLFGCLIV